MENNESSLKLFKVSFLDEDDDPDEELVCAVAAYNEKEAVEIARRDFFSDDFDEDELTCVLFPDNEAEEISVQVSLKSLLDGIKVTEPCVLAGSDD